MTTTETVESICRELAEREVPIGNRAVERSVLVKDPRFKALRGEHEWGDHPDYQECKWCEYMPSTLDPEQPYCLRTDLGAIVRAAAACGLRVTSVDYEEGVWGAVVNGPMKTMTLEPMVETYEPYAEASGDTPELAAARALREAIS